MLLILVLSSSNALEYLLAILAMESELQLRMPTEAEGSAVEVHRWLTEAEGSAVEAQRWSFILSYLSFSWKFLNYV